MKSISDADGLGRKQRLEKASAVVPLRVLEDDFPALLTRILRRSDKFAALYSYQPLLILAEIENFGLIVSEETFYDLKDEERKTVQVYDLVARIEDWRKRLEYACIHTSPLNLLRDMNMQIRRNIAPYFPLFRAQNNFKLPDGMGAVWFPEEKKASSGTDARRFTRRFFMLLLEMIGILQKNVAVYREEICSCGTMDPSLAVIVAFLKNYEAIAGRFNERWRQLPYVYLEEMMKATRRPGVPGGVWLAFDKSPAVREVRIPAGTYLSAADPSVQSGYKLFSEVLLSDTAVEEVDMVILEKSKERHPEVALDYVTGLLRIDINGKRRTPVAVGIKIESRVLLLREGERYVSMTCRLIKASFEEFNTLINSVCRVESDADKTVGRDEALFKILNDPFRLEVTTWSGWRAMERFRVRFMERERSFLFQFYLDREFPALEPLEGEELPAIRLLINNTSWLFPYSWARTMFFESVHIKADVRGIRDIELYNDLGQVDAKQPFAPFGVQPERGSWLVFGNYEMSCKRVAGIVLSFDWQQLPGEAGGLCGHYKGYRQKQMEEINNQSFRARTEYLQNDEWKPTPDGHTHYLFHTRSMLENGLPEPDGRLIDTASVAFDVSGSEPLHLSGPEDFRFGLVRSGFYRLVLDSPDMGFGDKYYRRIFTEVMLHNSHFRKKRPLPESPVSPLMDALQLNYIAEEECAFAIGQLCPMRISYINPVSTKADINPDTTRPIPLLQGPSDEANVIVAFSGAVGQNLIRMYVDMEVLQRKVDHGRLPETNWFFKSESKWLQLPPSGVLRDDTGCLMHSGGVELQLPHPVSEEMLDADGFFRLAVSVRKNLCNCSSIRNIYVNVGEAGVTDEPEKETAVPAVLNVRQIAPLQGAVKTESREEMRARLSERMSHRNRALLPDDYEQMTLQAFPEIVKVKCLPGVDAKKRDRRGVVTVVVCSAAEEQLPLCEDRLLCRVEEFLQQHASPFAIIDVIDPVYEEVTVFCGVTLRTGYSAGTAMADIRERIDSCVAPWFVRKDIPVFGYSFSMRDLYGRIRESMYVEKLHGIKMAHLTEDHCGAHYLNKGLSGKFEEITVAPSEPWAVLVPAATPYIIICTEEEWSGNLGYGDLELGRTFVIA